MKTYPESKLTDLLIEFDEMGFCPTTVCPNPEQTAIEWKEQIVKEIQNLQAENAELRHRAEVAERALLFLCDKTMSDISVMVFPSTKTQVQNKQELYDYCIEQAEREIAEEERK